MPEPVARYLSAVGKMAAAAADLTPDEARYLAGGGDASPAALVPMHGAVGNPTVELSPVLMETDPAQLVAAFHDADTRMDVLRAELGAQAQAKSEAARHLTMGRSKSEAARLLGVSRVVLYKHLNRGLGE